MITEDASREAMLNYEEQFLNLEIDLANSFLKRFQIANNVLKYIFDTLTQHNISKV